MAIDILCKLMSTMVVNIMSNTISASTKSLEGYCAFHRLMIMAVETWPELKVMIDKKIADFIKDESMASKKVVPNLGEFLPLLLVSSYNWKDIAEAYLKENFDRNVFWILQKFPHFGKSEYDPSIDSDDENGRNAKTFESNRVSFRLLQFHVFFMKLSKPPEMTLQQIAERYDSLYGHPTEAMKADLLSVVKQIMELGSWEEFFTVIGYPIPSPSDVNGWLRKSILNSIKKGYHKPGMGMQNPPLRASANSDKPVCKFWEADGKCKKGDYCPFAHPLKRQPPRAAEKKFQNVVSQAMIQNSVVKPNISWASVISPSTTSPSVPAPSPVINGKEEIKEEQPKVGNDSNNNNGSTGGRRNSGSSTVTSGQNYWKLLFDKK
eukprot:TRINITY_DN4202_c0_g1_i6.p1 TRINITY_DN4202_c0_g1~~TRINITY_DN4202_c0_g1_i6.p1  ORF type:complete len:378 (+),score=132.33 TRINITY_DN4202_c0_g1_i6:134-1267(+)